MLPLVDQASTILAAQSDSQHHLCLDPRIPNVDSWIYIIALFLLASCFTILPRSSAHNMHSLPQWNGRSVVTALRLHWLYRYAPAAGHHARVASETVHEPWRIKPTQRRVSAWSDGPGDVPDDPATPADSRGRLARCVCHPMPCRASLKKAGKSPFIRLAAVPRASPYPGPRRRVRSPFKRLAPYKPSKLPNPRAIVASPLRYSSCNHRPIRTGHPDESPSPTPGGMDGCLNWRA